MKFRKMAMITLYERQQETQMYGTVFWTLWEKVRVGWFERIALKQVFQCIICETDRQSRFDAWDRALRAGALGWPWEMGWGGTWEGSSEWGTHVHPWLIHVDVWQKPSQYYKVISLQKEKNNNNNLKIKNKSKQNTMSGPTRHHKQYNHAHKYFGHGILKNIKISNFICFKKL